MLIRKDHHVPEMAFIKPLRNRENRRTHGIIFLTLVVLSMVLFHPAMAIAKDPWGTMPPPAPTPAVHQKSNQQIMKEFGADVLANAPPDIKTGSNSQKAKYAFTQYCNRLADAKTPVNANLAGRALQLFTHGKADRWTCSDHSLNLQGLFEGMGIRDKDMVMIEADSSYPVVCPNSDHGALVVRDNDGKPYVFDAWAMAVENLNTDAEDNGNYEISNGGSFLYSGAERSTWNGMDIDQWGSTMRSAGYSQFSADGGGSWNQTSAGAAATFFAGLPEDYPASFTFVLFPKGGGNAVELLYNSPISVDDKGIVKAASHTDGPSPYVREYSQKTQLTDLSVTGKYDKNTGKISGDFTSHVISYSTSIEYDSWAKGSFTGQMARNGRTMTTYLTGSAYYHTIDMTTGRDLGKTEEKDWFPWTAAAVITQK
jgi:hypothetical protein